MHSLAKGDPVFSRFPEENGVDSSQIGANVIAGGAASDQLG